MKFVTERLALATVELLGLHVYRIDTPIARDGSA
jgi:hypothetical protein